MTSRRSHRKPAIFQLFTPWLDVLAIGAWAILLLKLWLAGQLYLLVHPNYIWLTVTSGFGLLAIAVLEAWRIGQRQRSANFDGMNIPQHVTLLVPTWSSSLLMVVAILGLLINPRPFSSDTAIHRGVTDSLTATRAVPQSFKPVNRPEERTLTEWARTLNVYPEPDAYTGQKAKVQGFVVHSQDLPDAFILITRFVITCCAADVYPVSLPVKLFASRSTYPPDKWLEVEGQMITADLNGKRQLAIEAARIAPIPEPKNPYEY